VASHVSVRAERSDDHAAIRLVNEAAFGGAEEAVLVDTLRAEGLVLVSLVAEVDHHVVGHILFGRMAIETSTGTVSAVSLAPMAVLPQFQRQGIGGHLVRRGLDLLREMGEQIVIVVGHPSYYPRFGFSSETARGLDGPFPREAFMAIELTPGALDRVQGRVRYPDAFGV
jgi:putative acetyltransferase